MFSAVFHPTILLNCSSASLRFCSARSSYWALISFSSLVKSTPGAAFISTVTSPVELLFSKVISWAKYWKQIIFSWRIKPSVYEWFSDHLLTSERHLLNFTVNVWCTIHVYLSIFCGKFCHSVCSNFSMLPKWAHSFSLGGKLSPSSFGLTMKY